MCEIRRSAARYDVYSLVHIHIRVFTGHNSHPFTGMHRSKVHFTFVLLVRVHAGHKCNNTFVHLRSTLSLHEREFALRERDPVEFAREIVLRGSFIGGVVSHDW